MKREPIWQHQPWALFLGLTLLAPESALSQPSPVPPEQTLASSATFRAYIRAAAQLYEELDYEASLNVLATAKTQAGSKDERAEAAIHEGIVLADLGHRHEAIKVFAEALRLKPNAQLPLKVSPKIEREFEEVRSQQESTITEQQEASTLSPPSINDSPLLPPEPKPAPTAQFLEQPLSNTQTALILHPETTAQERGILIKPKSGLSLGLTAFTAITGIQLASRASHNFNKAIASHNTSSRISINRTANFQQLGSAALLSAAAIAALVTVVGIVEDNTAPAEKRVR